MSSLYLSSFVINNLSNSIDAIMKEVKDIKNKVENFEETVAQLKDKNSESNAQDINTSITDIIHDFKQRKSKEILDINAAAHVKMEALKSYVAELKAKIGQKDEEIKEIKKKMYADFNEDMEAELEPLQSEIAELKAKIEQKDKMIADYVARNEELVQDRDKYRAEIQRAGGYMDMLNASINKFMVDAAAIKANNIKKIETDDPYHDICDKYAKRLSDALSELEEKHEK